MDLRRRTDGTRWTNGQMLWHMVFGYLIVWRLLPGVRLFGRLPDSYSRRFAAALNAGTRPFHVINYLGGCGGALVFHGPRLPRLLDRTVNQLHRRLDAESEASLRRRLHFPVELGPVLRGLHDRGRRVPLRHPALRLPSDPAHPRTGQSVTGYGK